MDQGEEEKFIVEFTVSYDKDRGILIERMAYENDEYFFKYHNMPLTRHCEQLQEIVRSIGVQRCKKIRVDTTEFSYEYFADGVPQFKRCRLNSIKQQMKKVADSYITKEIGAVKRSVTVAQNKGRKIDEKRIEISESMKAGEEYYHAERARRMNEVFGFQNQPTPDVPQDPATQNDPPQLRKVLLPTLPGPLLPISRVAITSPFDFHPPEQPMDQDASDFPDFPDLPDHDDDL